MNTALKLPPALLKVAQKIRLVVFDVDGVLTDGRLYFSDEGREFKAFHVRDGLGLKLLQQNSVIVAIITGRSSPLVSQRMAELGIDHVYQGRESKLSTFEELCSATGIPASETACIGDDLPDLPLMRLCGLSASVNDGHFLVKQAADWVSGMDGGRGAAREFCDLLLEAKGVLAKPA